MITCCGFGRAIATKSRHGCPDIPSEPYRVITPTIVIKTECIVVAIVPPEHVAHHAINGFEALVDQERVCETERHRGVIRPLALLESKVRGVRHILEIVRMFRIDISTRCELQCRPKCIPDAQAHHSAHAEVF